MKNEIIHVTDENNNPACVALNLFRIHASIYSDEHMNVNCPVCIEKFSVPSFETNITLADLVDDENYQAFMGLKD